MTVRVLAFVEGQTEEMFIKKIVAVALRDWSIEITATTPGRKRTVGGVQGWARTKRELLRFLKEDNERFVTTMFDYYGLPGDWPGKVADSAAKAESVENMMLEEISNEMAKDFQSERFIPYIQMHEFEALLFSAPDALGAVVPGEQDLTQNLRAIVRDFATPEEIDDSPLTAPSKRIVELSPGYQKVLHGIIAAQRIGLPLMENRCPHFKNWQLKLKSLGQKNSD